MKLKPSVKNILILLLVVVVIGTILIFQLCQQINKPEYNPYEYDLYELQKIDENLIKYSLTKKISLPGQTLNAITTDSQNNIYISGQKALQILNQQGTELKRFPLTNTVLCLAVDRDRHIYLGFTEHVEKWDQNGRVLNTWASFGEKAIITSLAVTTDYVFIADAGNHMVLRYDTQGKLDGFITGKEDFIIPSPYFDLAVDANHTLWIVHTGRHSIEGYTFAGNFITAWGKSSNQIAGFMGCCNPIHLLIMTDGSFVTVEKGIKRIKLYNESGQFKAVVAGPDNFSTGTKNLDIAVNNKAEVLALDPAAQSLLIFSPKE